MSFKCLNKGIPIILLLLASLTVHSIHIDVPSALRCPATADTGSHRGPWRSSHQCRPTQRCRRSSPHTDSCDRDDVGSAPVLSPPDPTDELSVQHSARGERKERRVDWPDNTKGWMWRGVSPPRRFFWNFKEKCKVLSISIVIKYFWPETRTGDGAESTPWEARDVNSIGGR